MKNLVVLVLFVVLDCSHVSAVEFAKWSEGTDVRVAIYIDAADDKKVEFPEPVALGVTESFKSAYRFQNIGSQVYIRALSKKAMKPIRVLAKGQKTSNVYVLRVETTANEHDAEDVKILITNDVSSVSRSSAGGVRQRTPAVTPIMLVRYASQQFYAPRHAQEAISGVRISPLDDSEDFSFIYGRGGLQIRPLASFTYGTLTVTALKAKNVSQLQNHRIDKTSFTRRIKGIGVVTQHDMLGVDEENNQTVVYIVTNGDLRANLILGGAQ